MVSSPRAPDAYKQAGADQQAQNSSAYASSILNNPNEISPYGSVNYSVAGWEQVPGADGKMQYTPRYTRTTSLSPDEQRIAGYDTGTRSNLGRTAVQQSAKIGGYLNEGLNTSGWQPWQTTAGPGEIRQDQGATDRPAIEQAMLARYKDQSGKANSAQDVQMALRGMSPGSQGYSDISDARNRSDVDAGQQAYLASGQESRQAQDAYNQAASTRYQLGADWASQNNALRQAQEQSSYAQRNQPINEIMALMGGSQVNMPNFAPFSRQGIASSSPGQYASQNYQNQLQMANATNQGLFSLGGSVLGGIGQAGGFRPFTGMKTA
jgi:hypothetical protein